jgi:hypothetical protein
MNHSSTSSFLDLFYVSYLETDNFKKHNVRDLRRLFSLTGGLILIIHLCGNRK